jgi:thioredoxin 1
MMATPNRINLFIIAGIFMACLFACNKPGDSKSFSGLPKISTPQGLDSASLAASGKMVVLDFYADWCGPCRVLAPTMESLAEEYKKKAIFYRINIDQSKELAGSYGVRGIPYVVFMKSGTPVYALRGLNPEENYRKILDLCGGGGSADDCIKTINEKM